MMSESRRLLAIVAIPLGAFIAGDCGRIVSGGNIAEADQMYADHDELAPPRFRGWISERHFYVGNAEKIYREARRAETPPPAEPSSLKMPGPAVPEAPSEGGAR
ncbi:MAG: hypothetical protein JWM88_662 [Verrucomicrobia bacterium]|nr:hypothetical protein [Verrucomicrobiota bacterium]